MRTFLAVFANFFTVYEVVSQPYSMGVSCKLKAGLPHIWGLQGLLFQLVPFFMLKHMSQSTLRKSFPQM